MDFYFFKHYTLFYIKVICADSVVIEIFLLLEANYFLINTRYNEKQNIPKIRSISILENNYVEFYLKDLRKYVIFFYIYCYKTREKPITPKVNTYNKTEKKITPVNIH